MNNEICKHNKYGHCKFGKNCYFKHENEKCEMENCETYKCNLRHPKDCRYMLKHGMCKFTEFCSFNHKTQHGTSSEAPKIEQLENIIKLMNFEIQKLKQKIDELENISLKENLEQINTKDHSDSSDGSSVDFEESSEEEHPEDISVYDSHIDTLEESESAPVLITCDLCNFTTQKKNGLKIHIGVTHKEETKPIENPEDDGLW